MKAVYGFMQSAVRYIGCCWRSEV